MPFRMFAWARFAFLSCTTVCGPLGDRTIRRLFSSTGALICLSLLVTAQPWQPLTAHAYTTEIGSPTISGKLGGADAISAPRGALEIRTNSVPAGKQARLVFRRAELERGTYTDCESATSDCHPRVRHWRASLERMRALSGLELLRELNATANELISYRTDVSVYGEVDHWATPVESLTGYGDCEDYAILKYLSLRELGYSAEQLRIRVVRDTDHDVGHAVLTVELDGRTYGLDNLSSELIQQSSLSRHQPLYAVNENGQWLNLAVRSRSAVVAMQTKD